MQKGHIVVELAEVAREFVNAPVSYTFSEQERMVARKFFTNTDRKVFFIRGLPAALASTLLAMYSRIKNPRGLRGHFVDNLLPFILASFMKDMRDATKAKEVGEFLTKNNIKSLDTFISFSEEAEELFEEFLECASADPEYMERLASSLKIRAFLGLNLDNYGHNSIARTAVELLGVEQVSILAAKSFEWARPGAGYIELSSRFVDMSMSSLYPFWNEFSVLNHDRAGWAKQVAVRSFEQYAIHMEDRESERSLWQALSSAYKGRTDPQDLQKGVFGEVCDVLGNFLPAATLTSLGMAVSGETLPMLFRHLILDGTPENAALGKLICEEAVKTGSNQFLRHLDLPAWSVLGWEYLDPGQFGAMARIQGGVSGIYDLVMPDVGTAERMLCNAFSDVKLFQEDCRTVEGIVRVMQRNAERTDHDKLSRQFEYVSGFGRGIMSFRGWRDLQRQGFCTHIRTLLTPLLGFYRYDKPAPKDFFDACARMHAENVDLYRELKEIPSLPEEMMQYPLAMGNMVGFQIGANLREFEFCDWQRTKFTVNHEVRRVFLSLERLLRNSYPWWEKLSRADMTPAYIFARTAEGIPL